MPSTISLDVTKTHINTNNNTSAASAQHSQTHLRPDLQIITDWIPAGSRVLDLGCGDGRLLAHLIQHKGCSGYGIEIDDANVLACAKQGVNIIQQDLEGGLELFNDASFDVVVLSQTLQAMHHTEKILREMARVARAGIVSFPNFGHWSHVWSILLGKMPVSKQMPYQWYDTPNIHLCTLKDFELLIAKLGMTISRQAVFNQHRQVKLFPQWLGTLAVYQFSGA
jgi:methionine biosynthesis protein MetW